jgi:hypothetical protein
MACWLVIPLAVLTMKFFETISALELYSLTLTPRAFILR